MLFATLVSVGLLLVLVLLTICWWKQCRDEMWILIFLILLLAASLIPLITAFNKVNEPPGNFTVYISGSSTPYQVMGYEYEQETGYFCFRLMDGTFMRVKNPHIIISNTKESWAKDNE